MNEHMYVHSYIYVCVYVCMYTHIYDDWHFFTDDSRLYTKKLLV